MEVHSARVQWPAPLQGPHLLICGSPLPGKYTSSELDFLSKIWLVIYVAPAIASFPLSIHNQANLRGY